MRTFRFGVLVAGLGLLIAACGGSDVEGPDAVRADPGNPAPDFAAVTLEGDSTRLTAYRGEPVLLNLWATWCAPCRFETPYLQEIHERFHEDGLRVVGVSQDTRSASRDIDAFVEEYGVTYDILHDPSMRVMDAYSAIGLPATFLIDGEGIIRWKRLGPVIEGDPDFEGAVEALLE